MQTVAIIYYFNRDARSIENRCDTRDPAPMALPLTRLLCVRVFHSLPAFWSFTAALVCSFPSAESLCAPGCEVPDRLSAGGLVWDRFAFIMPPASRGSESDSDVANLADLEAFDHGEAEPHVPDRAADSESWPHAVCGLSRRVRVALGARRSTV